MLWWWFWCCLYGRLKEHDAELREVLATHAKEIKAKEEEIDRLKTLLRQSEEKIARQEEQVAARDATADEEVKPPVSSSSATAAATATAVANDFSPCKSEHPEPSPSGTCEMQRKHSATSGERVCT